jgi:RHS repeat-associated protein
VTQTIVQRYAYDAFGMVTASNPEFENAYTYTGREWDKEIGLYYYRARYYDPMEGKFISKDPIGFAGGDVNLYRYVQNRPINLADPSGLLSVTGGAGLGGGFQMYFIGLNAHSRVECGSGGCYTITSVCGRLGPGMFLGGGTEVGASIGPDAEPSDECEESCEEDWSLGVGADVAFGNEGHVWGQV